ncbi:hypothetical protein GGTG_06964 [Gaeumannomyces tritici R3-111a-1]|uniref:Uncharacterized protein n=1 Tax=Gaeumannomyces tritici (strain R3-111a-1) TaxID=644352 RepID=J3P0B7_GAET3|nr:hypothetical protein GGTG_06964 [Gaeumannomyces tritici R3-111a-1]EJT77050.1 hypothetical protein GGTG_06964 [Gaeumannomyces tritici R3-111a-1]
MEARGRARDRCILSIYEVALLQPRAGPACVYAVVERNVSRFFSLAGGFACMQHYIPGSHLLPTGARAAVSIEIISIRPQHQQQGKHTVCLPGTPAPSVKSKRASEQASKQQQARHILEYQGAGRFGRPAVKD